MRPLLLALLLVACAPKKVESSPDWTTTPHLPSPRAGTYARVPAVPQDGVVARLVEDHRWDASLAGAASGLALAAVRGEGTLEDWAVREAAWQAGYPYPITRRAGWAVAYQAPPPDGLRDWLEQVPPDADLGLVRARTSADDAWLGLVSRPRADLGVLPREVQLGSSVSFPAVPGATLRVADADGHVSEQPLDAGARVTLSRAGEWLFQVIDAHGEVARFPIYAGMTAPREPLFEVADAPLRTLSDVEARAETLLASVREAYATDPWRRAARLDAAARVLRDTPDRARLEVSGLHALDVWRCEAPSVEDCLDRLVWDLDHRATLLAQGGRVGLAAALDRAGVRLVVVVDPETDGAAAAQGLR